MLQPGKRRRSAVSPAGLAFYFTLHPGDIMRTRILKGADVMLVASAFWDSDRKRLKVRRPPADHIGALSLDSGGFTAAARWGRYPWEPEAYVEWVRQMTRDVPAAFVACMDYACERGVDRSSLATNRERIEATWINENLLRTIAPDLPWLGVLQGNTLDERRWDIERRQRFGLLFPFMGLGSICRRPAREAADVIRFYREHVPGTRFHAFGLDCRALDCGDDAATAIASWDSYAYTWPRGKKGHDRPSFLLRRDDETRSAFTRRLAQHYEAHTIKPRIERPRQLPLVRCS